MNALEKALNAKFAATSTLTDAFPGNERSDDSFALYWDTAAKGAPTPYLVAQIISAPATSKYGGVTFSDVTVQFKAIGEGRRATIALMETFCGVFDEYAPVLDAGTVCGVERLSEPFALKLPVEETQGRDEYQVVTTYRYGIAP